MPMPTLIAGAASDTLWLVLTFFIFMPGIAVGLVVVAVVSARGEKRTNERTTSNRWGRRRGSPGDA